MEGIRSPSPEIKNFYIKKNIFLNMLSNTSDIK